MYDFQSTHVGKTKYRSKQSEEDIQITNEITKDKFSVSLKAYGDGSLQLSTDKTSAMYASLGQHTETVTDKEKINDVLTHLAFNTFGNVNVLCLIYKEKEKKCNVLVFDYERAKANITRIEYVVKGRGRKHPVYRFYDNEDTFVCEVRYGGATANALQRGFWTHTRNALKYFDSLTDGWIDYSPYPILVKLFSHALLSTSRGHVAALAALQKDIEEQKQQANLS